MTNENPPAPTTKNVNDEKPQQEETATNEETQKKTKTQEEMEAKEHWKYRTIDDVFFFKEISLREDFAKKTKNVCTYNKKNTRKYNKNRLTINAVYSNKKIHIASDPEVLEKDIELKIETMPSPDEKLFIIRYTGIWMTKEDLVNNIVIIVRSGTKKFIEIGQFGVGFYSTI
ncbi:Heat shock protein Hsp90 [Reticulomyxa filosa]|uniref:Heat shock protein Hsp90 n=1 Tax=Reticulomyxa filosa TaxID=46433 RepID=X6LHQ2_RETFI|nr:Heat shock protein Hsp90 [Reticulomyxa filosa]|eukprot:ETO00672.1 Heat shock protein Hsp90 [Reticulomyxa filosa]